MDEIGKERVPADQVPPQILELLLDVILDVMRAERGSIMLEDEGRNELTIRSARGLKNEIIRKTRVRLGTGISGKVAVAGQSVFLKGINEDRRLGIKSGDFVNSSINTSYILPFKLRGGTLGTVNISSEHPHNMIRPERERLVQGIISRFFEYLAQADLEPTPLDSPSQLVMMNVFREYHTLRELRAIFDFIFHLCSDMLSVKKKGIFLLKNSDSELFDLVLGYGFDILKQRQIYEELVPTLKNAHMESVRSIRIFNRRDLPLSPSAFFQEDYFIVLPLLCEDEQNGQILFLSDTPPLLDERKRELIERVCESAALTISESSSGRKFHELTLTDSLTRTYNYGLWWQRLHEEISRAQRIKDEKMSLIVLDIDHFERINKAHGYMVGDELLYTVADRIKSNVRPIDVVGRIGGEEFGVVLPGSAKDKAVDITERIFASTAEITNELRIQLISPLTMSAGVAGYPDDADTPGELVEKAKIALLSAKIMGGNRIKPFEWSGD